MNNLYQVISKIKLKWKNFKKFYNLNYKMYYKLIYIFKMFI